MSAIRLFGWIFGGIGFLTIVGVVLYNLYWDVPEKWNDTAKLYLSQVRGLQSDTIRYRATNRRLRQDSITLTQNNRNLKAELDTATLYGSQWKDLYQKEVAASDAYVDRLGEREKQLQLYKRLYENGTLSKPVSLTLEPKPIDITTASLKTAEREKMGKTTIDSLAKSYGVAKAAVRRMGIGLESFNSGAKDISINLRKKASKKTFLGFGRKLKRGMIEEADRLDNLREKVNEKTQLEKSTADNDESELEKAINPKNQ